MREILCVDGPDQANHQRADGLTQPRPVSLVQHEAANHPGTEHPAPSDALFPHHSRIRQSSHRCCPYSHSGSYHFHIFFISSSYHFHIIFSHPPTSSSSSTPFITSIQLFISDFNELSQRD